MPRMSLSEMLADLKAEVGHSLNLAHGTNARETMIYYLKRNQRDIYIGHDWPDLMYDVAADTLTAGQTIYAYPPNVAFEQINTIYTAHGSDWLPLTYGILPQHRSAYPPNSRSTPAMRWANYPAAAFNQWEIWPTPARSAEVLMRVTRHLDPLINDSDMSTLDGTLVVLFAAAEILARQKSEDAGLRLQKAQAYLRNLKMQMGTDKREPQVIGAGTPDAGLTGNAPAARPYRDYIPSA